MESIISTNLPLFFKALRMSVSFVKESKLNPRVPASAQGLCQAHNPLRMKPDVKNNQGEMHCSVKKAQVENTRVKI